MRRSPNGSITISPKSDPAALNSAISLQAAALCCSPVLPAAPGDVLTEQFDIDLKRRNGQSLPVRLLHRVAFGQDGLPGASRTLVFNRAPGEEPAEDLRAAEVRFARVFNATPMAIAIVDKAGRIKRSNAAFAKLMPEALKGADPALRGVYAGVLDHDRAPLEAAIAAAVELEN